MFLDLRLWQFTQGLRWRIAIAAGVGVLATAFGIARLALLGWLIAMVFQGALLADIALPAVGVMLVIVARGWLEYLRTMLAHNTAARVQASLREAIFDKVAQLGPAYFGLERTGDVVIAMIDGVEQLEIYFGQYIPQLIVSAAAPVMIFAFAMFLDWQVALVMLAAALVTLVAPQIFQKWSTAGSLARSRAYKAFAAEFLDSVQGIATLKAFGQSGARAAALRTKADDLFRSTMWVLATNSLGRGITDTGIAVGAAAALALGAYRVADGELSLAALSMILMMGVEVFRPLRDLRALLHNGMVAEAAARTIFQLLDAQPAVAEGSKHVAPNALRPTISFEDVAFTYPGGERTTYKGLSFNIEAGERVGFVGPSGVGKSSIVRLLLRFYDPDSGSIQIGGEDIRKLDFDSLRSQIAVVNQDTYLFHGTVADNLMVGNPDALPEDLEAACRAANAHSFILALPQGYDTVIGERGIRLSGGQRQRIAIARALLRDAPILVLDEALSAVDAENEAVIQEALDRLMQDRTTLIFAHRLSSVINADRIIALVDGSIAEVGRHDELMARKGAYHRLMAEQAAEWEARDGAPDIVHQTQAEPVAEQISDEAEAFAPTDAIIKAEGLGWFGAAQALMGHIGAYKAKLTLTFLFGVTRVLAFIGVGIVGALAVKAVKDGQPFEMLVLTLALLAPVAGLFHWFESWLAHDMAFRLLADMRIALFSKLEKLAPAYMVRRRTGDIVAMATHDVELVEYFFAHTVAPAFIAVLVPALTITVLLTFGWEIAVTLLPFLAIVALSPFLMRQRVDRLGSRAREALAELNAHAVDSIQGLSEVVAFQHVSKRRRQLIALTEDHHQVRLPFFKDLTFQTSLLEVATGLGGLAVIVAGTALVASGRLDSGMLPLLTLLAMASFLPISEIANISRQLADTLGSTRRLYAIENEPVVVEDGPGVSESCTSGGLGIVLENVNFQYEAGNRQALQDVSFRIPAGRTVALIGPSGAGKTTIAHLLMRFWDPDSGSVRLGGKDLREFKLDELRLQIALVAQDTYLFNDTLRANILLANPTASEEQLHAALMRASLTDFVDSLPDGLETKVGERGMRLSGGQRQRVSIARAFLKDAPLLILDEATSHLDAVNERAVREALDALMTNRTTIVIAHRLSTVRNADIIIAMDQGHVVEMGTHDELLAKGGLYAALVVHQLASAHVRGAAE